MPTRDVDAGGRPVITIWESAGSLMDEIAQRLSEMLNLPLHGQAISSAEIARVFSPEDDSGDDEFARLLHSFGPDSVVQTALSEADLASLREHTAQNTRSVLRHAREGGILLGRNGAYILRDWPNVLNVWLDGPEPERVNRAAEASDSASEMEALRLRLEDEIRVSMSIFSYGYDPRSIEHYDLVVNTCRLDVEAAAQLIAAAAVVLTSLQPGSASASPSGRVEGPVG